ncbi:metallophosphoesterase [bacterium]|nr:metallophosphoesterase [bacterium]
MDDTPPRQPDYVIRLMADAAKANRDDPCRTGHLVELPGQGDVLIAGDLHGHLANFRRIVRVADLPNHPHRHLILQELLHSMFDDTPDRSYQLLEEAAVLKNVYPSQVHIILANHDLAEVLGLDIMKKGRSVVRAFAEAVEEAYPHHKDAVHEAYAEFLVSLPWAVAAGNLFVCHSVPNERHLLPFSRELFTDPESDEPLSKTHPAFYLTWGRDISEKTAARFADSVGADVIVTGHHPCRDGHAQPNPHTVIIDSKDANGSYVILPLGRPFAQDDIVRRIRHLN